MPVQFLVSSCLLILLSCVSVSLPSDTVRGVEAGRLQEPDVGDVRDIRRGQDRGPELPAAGAGRAAVQDAGPQQGDGQAGRGRRRGGAGRRGGGGRRGRDRAPRHRPRHDAGQRHPRQGRQGSQGARRRHRQRHHGAHGLIMIYLCMPYGRFFLVIAVCFVQRRCSFLGFA
jgi:hypothetical protein